MVLLWGKPSRDWFNGVTPQQPERQERAPVHQHVGPRSFEGFGKSPSTGTGTGTGTGAEAQPAQPEGSTQQGTQPGPARPAAVVQACITTWVASAIVLVAMVVVVVGFSVYPNLVKEVYESDSRFADSDIDLSQLKQASLVLASLFIVWSVAAIVLAWFAFRRHNWARVALIVSAGMAGLLSLVLVISSPVLLVVTATCAATVVALSMKPARTWYQRRSATHHQ